MLTLGRSIRSCLSRRAERRRRTPPAHGGVRRSSRIAHHRGLPQSAPADRRAVLFAPSQASPTPELSLAGTRHTVHFLTLPPGQPPERRSGNDDQVSSELSSAFTIRPRVVGWSSTARLPRWPDLLPRAALVLRQIRSRRQSRTTTLSSGLGARAGRNALEFFASGDGGKRSTAGRARTRLCYATPIQGDCPPKK